MAGVVGIAAVIRSLAAATVVALALAACGGEVAAVLPEPDVDVFEVRILQLQRDVTAVVALQSEAVPLLDLPLASLRAVDAVLPRTLDEETIDDALDRVPDVRADVDAIDVADVRGAVLDVAFAVDEARLSLDAALDVVTDAGDRSYLQAEDEVLVAVRAHAEATDALAQVVALHRPAYVEAVDLLADFAERRGRFRSSSEAADALALELADVLRRIAVAQEDVARYVQQRRDAAVLVNLAQDRATAAWEARAASASELPGEDVSGEDLPGEGG